MAALITADADATIAADVITDVDVTVDGDFQAEIIPAVISSGSSSFCACAETITADAAMAAADVATVTTAGLLSCCFCYVETMAVDVAADNHFLLAGGAFPLPLYFYRIITSSLLFMLPDIILIFHIPGIDPVCFLFRVHCLSTLFFLFHTLQIYLIKSISIYNKHFFLFF